jgi:hypothetical protein
LIARVVGLVLDVLVVVLRRYGQVTVADALARLSPGLAEAIVGEVNRRLDAGELPELREAREPRDYDIVADKLAEAEAKTR